MTSLKWQDLPHQVLDVLRRGAVIPAHPLALDAARQFDRVSQRAVARYYIDAGAGGLAVGVHSRAHVSKRSPGTEIGPWRSNRKG